VQGDHEPNSRMAPALLFCFTTARRGGGEEPRR
jgi:hypothetical protein